MPGRSSALSIPPTGKAVELWRVFSRILTAPSHQLGETRCTLSLMKVFLRLSLPCTADAAWNALRSPRVFKQVMKPLFTVKSLEPGGLPDQWSQDDDHLVALRLFGVIPLGTQTIDVAFTERPGGVRMLIDTGHARTGPMRFIKDWDHRMAVSSRSDGRTLYRDRLIVRAGVLTPFVWIGMWLMWQHRAKKIKQLAKKW